MALTTIIRGRFAVGKNADGTDKKGNFVGWNGKGTQIHVPKELLLALNIKTDKDFIDKGSKLYANVETDVFDVTDENGTITGSRERVTAKVVDLDKSKLIAIAMEDDLLNIDYRKELEDKVTSASLSDASVKAILENSSFV